MPESNRHGQRGFTLVELMISLLLFSFAVAGILSVAVTMTRSFREQRRVNAMEQSARGPMDFIVDVLRQSSPGVATGVIADADTCATGAISVTDSSTGPDVLDVVYAAGGTVTTAHNTSTITNSTTLIPIPAVHLTEYAAGDYVLITDSDKGTLVKLTGTTGGLQMASSSCATNAYGAGYASRALILRAQRARFTIADLDGIPTLWMDPDGALGAAEPEPVAEGVEDMQIALGVDTNDDKNITESADGTNDEWYGNSATDTPLVGKTRAVRVVLVARDTSELQGPASFYKYAALNHSVSAAADKYRRRVLTSTVEIRNLLGSP
jgi:prepilin-type N-terminal cleavage/methylation domain-containing protein